MELIIDAAYENLDELQAATRGWNFDFRLVRSGAFRGRLRQAWGHDILVGYVNLSPGVHQAGDTPKDHVTFGIPAPGCGDFWWLNHHTNAKCLYSFGPARELAAAHKHNFAVYTISIRRAYLENVCALQDIADFPTDSKIYPLTDERLRELQTLARFAAFHSSPVLRNKAAHRLVAIILTRLTDTAARPNPSVRSRDRALKFILEFLASGPEDMPDMGKLCEIANVSERTLQYAFKDRYQISPQAFVRNWYLNTAQRELRNEAYASKSVADIAAGCGFYDPSLFARNYRSFFGVLPSVERPSKAFSRPG